MKIEKKIKDKYEELWQIPNGTCFVIKNDKDDNLYIKTNLTFEDKMDDRFERTDCVSLKDGTIKDFPTDAKVIPYYDVKITIEV